MVRRSLALAVVAVSTVASAQPVTTPTDAPLADIRDDKALAQALATIAQDPAVRVADPKARPLAAALLAEGVKQLQAAHYEQALANFLEAYDKLPSPKILLDIGSTLRDMGRLADAANTYQRYLADPATGTERIAEVKKLLLDLDAQLTLLTVRVSPKDAEVSIDGGPFIAVGTSFVARVRPGLHLVRARKGDATAEVTVNGFEGEVKEISASVPESTPTKPADKPALPMVKTHEEEQHYGWLDTSTQYGAADPTSTRREVHTGYAGPTVRAIVPEIPTQDELDAVAPPPPRDHAITTGVLGLARVDGHLRGAAGGLGIALAATPRLEVEVAALRSNQWGAYAGVRLRFLTGLLRPYVGAGLPVFLYDDENDAMSTKIAVGLRGSGGLEVRVTDHLSVQADAGFEYFFRLDSDALIEGKHPERTLFVPTLGVIGRL